MPEFHPPIPILRIFDETRAREFYLDFLGFTVDWEHRFEPEMPIYLQISLGSVSIQLSEHHGDACPGASVVIPITGIHDYHRQITAKPYKYYRPSVETPFWGGYQMSVQDPFGNRLHFRQR